MIDEKDIMSVEYTETDNETPALCFCSDIIVPITNKTGAQSYCNFMSNDLKFKILDLRIQNLMITYLSQDITSIKAKVGKKFVFMGLVNTNDLFRAMEKIVTKLKEKSDADQA